MQSQRNILIAFILNLFFSVFEFLGGLWTGSVAIVSDALHDLGDAMSLGLAYGLEKKSQRPPDAGHTFGYARYSVLGALITTCILMTGSVAVIVGAVTRLLHPTPIRYDGMIVFALVGICVNSLAAYVTHRGQSMNQKAVSLHMLEDVLGWGVVLAGALVMRFTDLALLDPLLSMGTALYIGYHAVKSLIRVGGLFLLSTPENTPVDRVRNGVMKLDGVLDVHHIHLWSFDGLANCATMHVVTNKDPHAVKSQIRHLLSHMDIVHVTLELEAENEPCTAPTCQPIPKLRHSCHHHHH